MQTSIFRQRYLQAILRGAVGRLIYTYNDRQIGVAWPTAQMKFPAAASDESSESTENTDPAEKQILQMIIKTVRHLT